MTKQSLYAEVDRLQTLLDALRSESTETETVETTYRFPVLSMLKNHQSVSEASTMEASVLESKLAEFGFMGKVVNISKGPLITRYGVKLDAGVRLNQIRNVSEDLAVALMSDKVRILAPIPGTSLVGIEVVNKTLSIVGLRQVMREAIILGRRARNRYELPIALGVDTMGNAKVLNLADMPHLLIAGQTGSGKSVCLNVLILSLLYARKPEECKLILIDPKRVEMTCYQGIPHLKQPVVTEPENAMEVFEDLVHEMETRYRLLSENGVRKISSYNELKTVEKMPYIVTVVDEMADLMMTSGKELETAVVRLAQLGRAVGIHLVLATQKPVTKVITGLIKSNMTSRIAFQVATNMDSRVILDSSGAENLVGRGDMLALYPGVTEPVRLHGCWVSDAETQKVTDSLRRAEI